MDIDPEEWLTSSNECFYINFYRSTNDDGEPIRILDEPFNPRFTYPIFGDDELLVGYKNPAIELDFRANDLAPRLKVQFEDENNDIRRALPEDKQVNLKLDLFKGAVPDEILENDGVSKAPPTSKDWKPPGALIHNFKLSGKQYEIWKSPLMDDAARQIWNNMKVLVLLFIEGATLEGLEDDDTLDRWSIYLLYEVVDLDDNVASPYTLAGFSTSFRSWVFPTFEVMRAIKMLPSPPESTNGDAEKYTPPRLTQDPETFFFNEKLDRLETPSRERISQFLILPEYQGQSLGATLYDTIFEDLVKKPYIYEIPVEDPSAEFDAMRDYSDIAYLRKLPNFQSVALVSELPAEALRKDAPVPRDQILGNGVDLEVLRHESKIVPRQFNRVLELHLLSTIPPLHRQKARITRKAKSSNENDRKYYFWRLALKHRIYRQNADTLDQLEDATERVEKLEDAVDSQQEEYEERLEGLLKRERWASGKASLNGANAKSKRKRAIVDDEEDEWEDMDVASVASSKRMKS